jgi:hypothetical protein
MFTNLTEKEWFRYRFPAYVAGCSAITFLPLTVSSSDLAVMLYVFAAVPVVSFVLLFIARQRKGIQRLAALSVFGVFLVFTAILAKDFLKIRTAAQWAVHSRGYKAKVLAQSRFSNGHFGHVELQGWGFAGQDTVVYVVHDPKGSLAMAAKSGSPGAFSGLPCEVYRVRKLESDWYSVQFYTGTDWDHCN